jgi:hypothetical protein
MRALDLRIRRESQGVRWRTWDQMGRTPLSLVPLNKHYGCVFETCSTSFSSGPAFQFALSCSNTYKPSAR